MAASTPCCTLGLVKEGTVPCAFLALRPGESIPARDVANAFNHGHALLGAPECAVIQFGFTFFGFSTYHVLVNPSNPMVQSVLASMIDRRHYFVLAINPDHRITAFRAELRQDSLARLTGSRRRLHGSTTEFQYQHTLAHFRLHPRPPGRVLEWVCRESLDYLDPTQDRLEISPAD
jgi:hypothetical protein